MVHGVEPCRGKPAPAAGCDHGAGWHEGTEPFIASAPAAARAWLLIEHQGPWPRRPVDAAFPPPLRTAVAAAADLGIRIQLIRRPGRRRAAPAAQGRATATQGLPSRIFVGWSAGPRPWLARRSIADAGDLARLDLAALALGRRDTDGDAVPGPLLLVCTHGRRNVCCARLGRPLAAALAPRHGAAVWETTHVGGDRHAANLVILPHGLYYGPVDPPSAEAAIDAYRRGEVILDRFRGRAGQAESTQATEHVIRQLTGLRGIDDLLAAAERS
jgi:hypothetical protein